MLHTTNRRTAVMMLGSVSLLALGASAHAQGVPLSNGQAAQVAPLQGKVSVRPVLIEEVTVTAQRRRQRLLDTPAPVTAIDPVTLVRSAAVGFADYQARVPGFELLSQREGESQLILRGITTGPQPNSTVGIYVDDTPYGTSNIYSNGGILTPDIDPADLERIEVLRGPQGTLYGADTLGGLLKFVTTPPDLTGYHGRVEGDGIVVDHGGTGYGLRAMLNVPIITDTLAIRANYYDRDDPGFIQDAVRGRHDLNSTHVQGGRVSALYRPIERLTIRLTATVQNLRSSGTPDEDVNATANSVTPTYGDYLQRRFTNEIFDNEYRIYNGDISYDLGFATLNASTSYSTLASTNIIDVTTALGFIGGLFGIPNFGVTEPEPVHTQRFTEEVRLVSKSGPQFDWQVGFYFDHERATELQAFDTFDTTTGAPLAIGNLAQVSLQSRYTEYAGYGDATYHFTPTIDLLAGVRYSGNRQNFTQGEGGPLGGGAFTATAGKSNDTSATFVVAPSWKFAPDNMVYARIASGYRPGGPNIITPAELSGGVPPSFKPDTLVNYELGYKSSLLDHHLTLDLSAFYINWKDVQLLTRTGVFTAEGNGGTAASEGFEGSVTYVPFPGLTLSDNAAYTEARLTEDAPGAGGRDGDELPYVPHWSENANADYDFSPLPGFDAYVGASLRFTGERTSAFITPIGSLRPKLPSYEQVDLRTGVTHGPYALSLYVKNLNDSRGITDLSSLQETPGTNPFAASLIQPRTFGFSLSAQF